jgi:hypothetical protein
MGYKESKTGSCGGVDPLQNGKKNIAQRGAAGNVEVPAPTTTERIDRTLSDVAGDERT